MLLLSALLLAAAQPTKASHPTRDLVVIGRLKNLDYELVSDPDDLIGHGWIKAEIRIERVLRGRAPSRVIAVRYFAHTYRGEGGLVRYRLRAAKNGTYVICAKQGDLGARCR